MKPTIVAQFKQLIIEVETSILNQLIVGQLRADWSWSVSVGEQVLSLAQSQ